MHRAPVEELNKFLSAQTIPQIEHFLDLKQGRIDLFKKSIEEASKVKGIYCEFGVMSGGTTNQIAELIPDKTLYGFDSFEGVTEDFSPAHPKGSWVFGIPPLNKNVELIKGFYQDTLDKFFKTYTGKLAFVHMSSGIYSSTVYLLETFKKYNRLQVGTIIQFDTMFYTNDNDGYWYQNEYIAWTDFCKKYNIAAEYVAWAGFGHCIYRITKV